MNLTTKQNTVERLVSLYWKHVTNIRAGKNRKKIKAI